MFGKPKDDQDRVPPPVRQFQHLAAMHSEEQAPTDQISCISRGMTIVGKISGDGTIQIFGRVEGELHAAAILINEGAHVEGEIAAEELTIGGRVKGTIRANRVKLNSTAVVEGDIFHKSLAIEENARFEGSSKREDSAVDVSRAPLSRRVPQDHSQANVTAIEGNWKSNGASDHDERPAAGAL
jgi:cytoskeletal protein CcmA (bactofilin family)